MNIFFQYIFFFSHHTEYEMRSSVWSSDVSSSDLDPAETRLVLIAAKPHISGHPTKFCGFCAFHLRPVLIINSKASDMMDGLNGAATGVLLYGSNSCSRSSRCRSRRCRILVHRHGAQRRPDRKSTRLNSSH